MFSVINAMKLAFQPLNLRNVTCSNSVSCLLIIASIDCSIDY